MASTDIHSKTENLTTPANDQGSVPIYDASSSHQHSHSCNDPSHHHHEHPFYFDEENNDSSATAAKNEMMMKRKAKKSQKQDTTRAEMIPGHRGDRNIDDLVNFINGSASANNNAGSKKSKKKSTTIS
jgi:hypothetical protein